MDTEDRKLEWAKGFGATHTINAKNTDPVQGIRDLTEVGDEAARLEEYRERGY